MGPIAQVEVVNFWPTSPARVQTVQELAPPPPSFWPIAHFPLDFSPNPPYNPPYAPLRYYLNYRQAGHGFLIWSALKVYLPRAAPRPAKRSRAAASERRTAARRPSRPRHSAATSLHGTPTALSRGSLLSPGRADLSTLRATPARVPWVSGNPPVARERGVPACEAPSGGVGGELAACGSGRRGPGRRAVAGLGAGGDARSGPRRRRERGLQVVRLTSGPCERSRGCVRASWRAVRSPWRSLSGEREGGGQRSGPDARSASRELGDCPGATVGDGCAPDRPVRRLSRRCAGSRWPRGGAPRARACGTPAALGCRRALAHGPPPPCPEPLPRRAQPDRRVRDEGTGGPVVTRWRALGVWRQYLPVGRVSGFGTVRGRRGECGAVARDARGAAWARG